MGKEWEMRCDQLKKEEAYPPVFKELSDRELDSKLQIPGDVRVKRKYLLEMMEGKS